MSFYVDHYLRLRRATFALLCHGIRFDVEGARQKARELEIRKDIIKGELDVITENHHLYAIDRHRSPKLIELLAAKKRLVEEKNAIPKALKAERKLKLLDIKEASARVAACRADGTDVVVEIGTGLSDQKIIHYLYDKLNCPKHFKKNKQTGKTSLSCDEVALKKIAMARPELQNLVQFILEHRKCIKLLEKLDENIYDEDGRIRSFYKPFGTQTGRLSSSSNPVDTGTNVQNFDGSLKYLLLPDPD